MVEQKVEINRDTHRFVKENLQRWARILPFSERFGGLDFSQAEEALVINALVKHGDLYLALLRSNTNDSNTGIWNNVAGYVQGKGEVDTDIIDTLNEELNTEAGIDLATADVITVGEILPVSLSRRTLYVVPALVHFSARPQIILNEEHTDYAWLTRAEFLGRQTVPVVARVFDTMIGPDPEA